MFDPITLIQTFGTIGVFAMVFAESGLFFGFFLPGDSLLFSAGLLAGTGFLNIWVLLVGCIIFAILGDSAGYWFGKKIGYKIFYKEDSFFFNKKYIDRAKMFFEKYGKKAILFARFVPIVRTFVPILAGVGNMEYKYFIPYNITGGISWVLIMTLLGYFLGNLIPGIEHYIIYIALGIIVVSFVPVVRFIMKR